MQKTIENPKVFISYAWGTEEYQSKVLAFAIRLQNEMGIEVVIDKWSMDPGNDTVAFMEKSVKDPSIHFVLILLDKVYSEKADGRLGGVGTETQIISPKVYKDVEQNKFIPIVFERDADGNICKPVFLESRLHFDLTNANAEEELHRLVRHIYGQKTYPVPPKGKKPTWVDEVAIFPSSFYATISQLKNNNINKKHNLSLILDDIVSTMVTNNTIDANCSYETLLKNFDENKGVRDAYLACIEEVFDQAYCCPSREHIASSKDIQSVGYINSSNENVQSLPRRCLFRK